MTLNGITSLTKILPDIVNALVGKVSLELLTICFIKALRAVHFRENKKYYNCNSIILVDQELQK
jgi:hypothetical protein